MSMPENHPPARIRGVAGAGSAAVGEEVGEAPKTAVVVVVAARDGEADCRVQY